MQKRGSAALWVWVIYGLLLAMTTGIFLLFREAWLLPQWWLSLGAMGAVETMALLYTLTLLARGGQAGRMVPGYAASGAVIVLYGGVVLFHILFFGLWLDLPAMKYLLVHLITLIGAVILLIVTGLFTRHTAGSEGQTRAALQDWRQMQLSVLKVKQSLDTWRHPSHEPLRLRLTKLEEELRFSDPISHPAVADTERRMLEQLSLLSDSVRLLPTKEDPDPTMQHIYGLIEDISHSLTQRNMELKGAKS